MFIHCPSMRTGHFSKPVARAVTTLTLLKIVINAGFRFVYPFLPALGRGLGVDLGRMGVLLSVRWGVGFAVPFAVGTERTASRSRRLLVAGLIAFGAGSLITAIAGIFVGAIVGFALMGIGKPVFDIGAQTYVSERVPYMRRARALGILELAWAGGLLIGAPMAGWLIDRWGWEVPFWAFGSIALLSIGAVLLLLEDRDGGGEPVARAVDQPMSVVMPFLAVVIIAGFTLELVLVVLGAWLENEFGMTLLALSGVGFLLGIAELVGEGAMLSIADRLGKRNSFAIGLFVSSLTLVTLGFANTRLALALTALFLVTISLEFSVISGIPLASEYRPNNRSRFLAWFMVSAGVGRIGADLVGPMLFESAGMSAIAFIAASAALLGAVILVTSVSEIQADQSLRTPM